MKEVNKIKKIYEGFFGEEVPAEVAEERRKICASCEFNSVNVEKLSLIGGIRKAFAPPFCTLCECQIHEKTGSPLEECAMYMVGEPKKWLKQKLETMASTNLDLVKGSHTDTYDMEIKDDEFVITLGEVESGQISDFDLIFHSKEGKNIEFTNMNVTCYCTTSKTEEVDSRTLKSNFKITASRLGLGAQSKVATLNYKMNGIPQSQKLRFKLFRTK